MKNISDMTSHNQNSRVRFTPRQLIKYHMEHPEIPITDTDIENLILDFPDISTWLEENQTTDNNSGMGYINKIGSFGTMMLM